MTFKAIKYSPKSEQLFFSELKKRVSAHFGTKKSNRANLTMYLKTFFMTMGYYVPFASLFLWEDIPGGAFFGIWAIMGFAMAGIGLSIMHDANHGAYSKNATVNAILGGFVNLVGGSAHNWKIQHNILHHTYTNVTGYDEDIAPVSLLRFSPHEKLKSIHKFQFLYAWFFYGLMTIEWITTKDFKGLFRYNKMGFVKTGFGKELFKLVIWKLVYYAVNLVLPLLFLDVPVWWVIVGFLSMHFIAGLLLGMIFQPAHVMETSDFPLPNEESTIENTWAVHQLHTTANFAPKNFWLNWYAGGLNYQIEHHLFPNICHVHYKELSKIVKQTASEFGLPYNVQSSFTSAIINHGKMLKKLGRA